jgi:predicted O-methyltransferase YrrM
MNLFKSFWRKIITRDVQTNPKDMALDYLRYNVRHFLPSYILSLDDDLFPTNQRLIDLSLKAARSASGIDLSDISRKFPFEVVGKFINVWPGEHYRLLAAIVKELKPQLVVEIGTATGASSLAMKEYLPKNGKIITYDIIPWNEYPASGLNQQDFDQQLEQRVLDITIQGNAESQYDMLQKANLIFIDAAKDGIMENAFIKLFDHISFDNNPIVVFDDIKFEIMIHIWRDIKHPKLDITSFGHWSGTGLVDWNKS